MRTLVVLTILLPAVIFCRTYTVFYFDQSLSPIAVNVRYERDDVLNFLFEKLSQPEAGALTFVPKNLLRAYFFVEKSLVIDLRSSAVAGLNFQEERYLIHQLLRTIFENFKAIDSVYFVVDGKRRERLLNYVDIRYGFVRDIWSNWPIEGGS